MSEIWRSLYQRTLTKLPPGLAVSLDFFRIQHQWPNLKQPKTFSEKIQARKLFDRNSVYPVLADKHLVKEFVADKLGEAWVTPTIWCGAKLPPRSLRRWSVPYVLKAAHSSGQNAFIKKSSDEDWDDIEATVERWLRHRHGKPFHEWLYSRIQPRILVEPFIGREGISPLDYKFFVFAGKLAYIQVDTDRATRHKRCFYNRSWQKEIFTLSYPMEYRDIPPPVCLDEMIAGAEMLADGFDFVRVDLYEVAGKPVFGEMTFYPGSGREIFNPRSFDAHLGSLWSPSQAAKSGVRS